MPLFCYFILWRTLDAIYSSEATWSPESSKKHFQASQAKLVPPSWRLPQNQDKGEGSEALTLGTEYKSTQNALTKMNDILV